jgi:hypothetical protein
MLKRFFAVTVLFLAAVCTWPAASEAQDLKSGPQAGEIIPGAFQPLNLNGPFVDRNHCLVCEYRLNPVALVFVRAQPEGIDPAVKKLLEALDQVANEHYLDTGMASFVVFLTPQARSGATEAAAGDPKAIIEEAIGREKLIKNLSDFAKSFKRVIVTCYPAENVAPKYRLADKAEVTVLVYARHRVFANFAFAEGQLKQDGVDKVVQGVEAMLERLKKSPGVDKKG